MCSIILYIFKALVPTPGSGFQSISQFTFSSKTHCSHIISSPRFPYLSAGNLDFMNLIKHNNTHNCARYPSFPRLKHLSFPRISLMWVVVPESSISPAPGTSPVTWLQVDHTSGLELTNISPVFVKSRITSHTHLAVNLWRGTVLFARQSDRWFPCCCSFPSSVLLLLCPAGLDLVQT